MVFVAAIGDVVASGTIGAVRDVHARTALPRWVIVLPLPGAFLGKDTAMYAIVTRRRMNPGQNDATRARFTRDYREALAQAPTFASFTLVEGERGVNTAILVFDTKEAADAFLDHPAIVAWRQALDALGHDLELEDRGPVMQSLSLSR